MPPSPQGASPEPSPFSRRDSSHARVPLRGAPDVAQTFYDRPTTGRKYHLRDRPDMLLVIRADYGNGQFKGTLTVSGVGVVGTIKVKEHHLDRLWVAA